MFILFSVEVYAVSRKKNCKKNLVKIFSFSDNKVVFTLLIEIVIV